MGLNLEISSIISGQLSWFVVLPEVQSFKLAIVSSILYAEEPHINDQGLERNCESCGRGLFR